MHGRDAGDTSMLKDQTHHEIDYAGIHRALLTGLLGNIGHKTDQFEYTGARGTKFAVFPGSALFKRKPQWLVSAEIVETTKLYARTNARIDPVWISRVAEALVKRIGGSIEVYDLDPQMGAPSGR
jgi:HrpA-like RNA helicase